MAEHVVVSGGVLMTDSGEAIVPGLRTAEHAGLDHSVVRGVGMNRSTHDAYDHSSVPGVMTAAQHAAVDHTTMPGVPAAGLTKAAHAAIDHTGLTGVVAAPAPSVLVAAAGFLVGAGAPAKTLGVDGNFYFRTDGGALSHIYARVAGVWTGLV